MNCGLRIADRGFGARQRRPGGRAALLTFRNPQSEVRHPAATRRAVTLIELLIVMVIIMILAAAVLGTASAAMESARRRRTETVIAKIHTLIMEQYGSYATRRVELQPVLMNAVNSGFPASANPANRGKALADLRLLGIRELLRYEMPERWTDFLPTAPLVLATRPALANTYHRRWLSVNPSGNGPTDQYQGAECLFMTVMFACGDGEARTLFSKQDIGDVDGDGAPEILDGWGQPISWLRAPAGFVSTLQPLNAAGIHDGEADHDPFDLYRRDALNVAHPTPSNPQYPSAILQELAVIQNRQFPAYRITPLVYSAGPDGISDIHSKQRVGTLVDPYSQTVDAVQVGFGVDEDGDGENWKDNIHNHAIRID